MYTYFSRFLHNTLSHSDRKPQTTSILSYSGLPRISRWNKFATWFDLGHRVKPDGDRVCAGRSMVEMLGVLAIIGVLSVGAIAGYSKAMMKYKLNKHAESINMLINNSLQMLSQLGAKEDNKKYHAKTLYKLGLIPDGIKYNNTDILYDIFNNHIYVYTKDKADSTYNYGISFHHTDENRSFDINSCRNIVTVAKENSANLKRVTAYNTDEASHFGALVGDNYCDSSHRCLRNLTLNDIDNLCNNKVSVLYVLWD